jgi:hypothetical protein
MATTAYTAIIEKEGDLYAALCPELDVASQGATVEETASNLREAHPTKTRNVPRNPHRMATEWQQAHSEF